MSSSTNQSSPAQQRRVLPPGYHLRNFFTLLDYVCRVYDDLLAPTDRHFARRFRALDCDSQSLYVRLCMRKGPLFRSDSLVYEDIDDVTAALQQLAEKQLIREYPDAEPTQLLSLLRKPELETLAREADLSPGSLRKDDLIHVISNALDTPTLHKTLTAEYHWIERQQDTVVRRFKLLFFGNARQDFSEFITSQLGIVRYEDYTIDHNCRFFQNQTRLQLLESLTDIQQQIEDTAETLSATDLLHHIEPINDIRLEAAQHNDAYIENKAERMITHLTRQLERLAPEAALSCYGFSRYPPSRERQARLLEKQHRDEAALVLVKQVEAEPQHPDEAETLQALKKKLYRKLNKTMPAAAPRIEYRNRTLQLPRQEGAIEYQVAQHLSEQEGLCLPLENQLFCGLFGLYFWDIIFSPQADAFFNPYQFGPRDLWSDTFYPKRKTAIDQRLAVLQHSTNWRDLLRQHSQQKAGLANYFVNWQLFTTTLVEQLCDHIPGHHLYAVFSKMLENPGYYRNGFPDLVLLTATGYELWEVKGPTDSLQTNQRRWLTYFQDHDIPAGVLHVVWQA